MKSENMLFANTHQHSHFFNMCELDLQRNIAANFAVRLRSKYRTNVKNFVTFSCVKSVSEHIIMIKC